MSKDTRKVARGPLGDARPDHEAEDDRPKGKPVEEVEDRPNVGTVKPEDYPVKDRDRARPD